MPKDKRALANFADDFYYLQKDKKGYNRARMMKSYQLAFKAGFTPKELDKTADTILKLVRRQP